jgi:hypothetical protein
VAAKAGRRYVLIDESAEAVRVAAERLAALGASAVRDIRSPRTG